MNSITNVLYWISTGLMVPVVAILIFLFFKALIMVGNFYTQFVSKRRNNNLINLKFEQMDSENASQIIGSLPDNNQVLVLNYLRRMLNLKDNEAHLHRLLANFEIDADKDLAKSKTLSKLGPILGLMGTLIPMGPALVGLSTGDIGSMASNMQVAFATTVIGLVIGAIGFLTQQIKQRWYLQDYTNLEFVVKLFIEKKHKQ